MSGASLLGFGLVLPFWGVNMLCIDQRTARALLLLQAAVFAWAFRVRS